MTDCASEQKLLSELRVTELKHELEKRNLDKNGIKIILTDRLEKALIADGHDPTTYLFRINEPVGASPKSTKQMSPTNSVDNSADIEMNTPEPAFENGNGVAKGDHNEEPVQMDSEAAQLAANSGIEKADNMGDNAKELIIADELAPAASLTTNDEEMLEDPLADVPAESTTPSAKLAVTISAQLPAKTPVQAPLPDEKENDIAARSIWVRGLTSATKAADLKVLCTQYGKVVRAKIYTSKKQSTSACYGYVTMADTAAAERAAAAMHKTQIRGRTISVEKADRSKVPAVKPTATTPMKKDASNESPAKRDSEKKLTVDGSKNKAEVVTEKSQSADARTKGAGSSTSALSKRDNSRSDRKRDDKERQRSSNNERRDSEKLSKSSVGRRDFSRRVVARDPRRDSQRTISAARRYPLTRGITSHTLRGRITRPGERGGYVSSIRRPEAMSQRDLLTLMRRKEEEHRRREAEIEKERALERERERIRFEREQLEKERLQLQLQAALQQQKMVAMSSSRTKDSYAPRSSSRSRHSEYRSSRDGRGDKLSSPSPRHRSSGESRRSLTESHSRHIGSNDRSSSSRVERDRSEHKSSAATSRGRSRHDSYSSPRRHGSSQPATYSSGKEYERGYSSSRGGHSFSGRGNSYFGNSRDAYSSTTSRIGSSTGWGSSSGAGFGSSSAWERNGGTTVSHSGGGSAWSGRGGGGNGGWSTFGSGGGASTSGGMRYDYDKYQQRF